MPACLPEQLWVTRRGPAAARRASGSIGRSGGHPRSRSDNPPVRRSCRTSRTWTGSPLWDAHMTATRSSGSGSAIRRRDTAACRGFIDERENTRRSGSPRAASTRPRGSHTTAWPRWTLSTRPERTTRTSGAAVGTQRSLASRAMVGGSGGSAGVPEGVPETLVVLGRISFHHVDEDANDLGVELGSGAVPELGEGAFGADRAAVRTVAGHRVERVGDGE